MYSRRYLPSGGQPDGKRPRVPENMPVKTGLFQAKSLGAMLTVLGLPVLTAKPSGNVIKARWSRWLMIPQAAPAIKSRHKPAFYCIRVTS